MLNQSISPQEVKNVQAEKCLTNVFPAMEAVLGQLGKAFDLHRSGAKISKDDLHKLYLMTAEIIAFVENMEAWS